MKLCPVCGKDHAIWPEQCVRTVKAVHSTVCGVSGAHTEGCKSVSMAKYLIKFVKGKRS